MNLFKVADQKVYKKASVGTDDFGKWIAEMGTDSGDKISS